MKTSISKAASKRTGHRLLASAHGAVTRGLKYIADSPPHKHGGFHPQTVEIAKAALKEIRRLRRAEKWTMRHNEILCDFINREMKMAAGDPRLAELMRRIEKSPNDEVSDPCRA